MMSLLSELCLRLFGFSVKNQSLLNLRDTYPIYMCHVSLLVLEQKIYNIRKRFKIDRTMSF
jgi:hypothetical protein